MTKLIKLIQNAIAVIKHSIKRFPITIILSVVCMILGIMLNHLDGNDLLEKILLTVTLGIPLSAAITLYVEKKSLTQKKNIILTISTFIFLFIFYIITPEELNNEFMIKYITLLVTFTIIFTLVPFFYKNENYHLYVMKLIVIFFSTLLFSLVLVLGINSILLAVETLFEININSELYNDVFIVIFFAFFMVHFFGSIPNKEKAHKLSVKPRVLEILITNISIPLLSCYTLILYLYFIKILIEFNLPDGMISNLVVWFGFFSVIIMFFNDKRNSKNLLVSRYTRYAPFTVLLPLIIMFVSLFIRIKQYGFTQGRYYALSGGLWLLISVLYLGLNKNRYKAFLVTSAMALMLVSAFGPLNSSSVSKYDQNQRFEKLLVDNKILVNGNFKNDVTLDKVQIERINDILRYFDNYYELSDIKVFPTDITFEKIKKLIGVSYEYNYRLYENNHIRVDNFKDSIVEISTYDYFVELSNVDENIDLRIDDLEVIITDDNHLNIYKKNILIYEKELKKVFNEYHRKSMDFDSRDELTVHDSNESILVSYIIKSFNGEKENEIIDVDNFQIQLLIKFK